MTFHATLAQLAATPAAAIHGCDPDSLEAQVQGITTDSRAIVPGNLFVALKGERYDGHEFVARAKELGAMVEALLLFGYNQGITKI